MKQLFVAVILSIALFGPSAQAQQKIGHINMDDLIGSMPEYQAGVKEIQELQASLEKQGQELKAEAEQKQEQFIKDSINYSAAMKEIKYDELLKLYQRLNNYSEEIQERLNQAKQQKIAPIYQKAMDNVKAVAKEAGYTYIMDSNTLLVSPSSDDIINKVKTKMGIKDPAPEKPATPAGKKP